MTPPLPPSSLLDDPEPDDAILITPAQLTEYQRLQAESLALQNCLALCARYLRQRIQATEGTTEERELWQAAQAFLCENPQE